MSGFDHEVTSIHNERYRVVEHAAMRRVERRVIGGDYGATSYTTAAQADHMAALLQLSSGDRLLDVGSGAGWPGIHLADSTGARLVLVDIPREGLAVSRRRLELDGVPGHVVAASGHALPFGDGTFDAVSSSDVLCCLPDKRAVLAESHRVLRPGGRICFAVIAVADGLGDDEHRAAVEHGPPHVGAGPGYQTLLAEAGFTAIDTLDVTGEFLATSTAWVRECDAAAATLRPLLGAAAFEERQETRRQANEVIGRGLLRRHIYWARSGALAT